MSSVAALWAFPAPAESGALRPPAVPYAPEWIGSPNVYSSRGERAVVAIVIHTMAGTLAGSDAWFNNPNSGVSAHYGIGFAGEQHQYVRLDQGAWTNGVLEPGNNWEGLLGYSGNPNLQTITIETADDGDPARCAVTAAMYESVYSVCHEVVSRFPSIRWLLRHTDISPKSRPGCPGNRWVGTGMFQYLARELRLSSALPGGLASYPWGFWTASEIAAASGCPIANVEAYWPLLYGQLDRRGVADRLTCAGTIGTIAVETAYTFAPVREAFWHTEAWRKKNLRYYPYYGRGFIQLTWDYNYRSYGYVLGVNLLDSPDLALEPDTAAAVFAEYFVMRGVAEAAQQSNWPEVRRRVKGDLEGLERLTAVITALGVN